MKDVIFILPSAGNKPVGGYKVVYEYANRLAKRGWKVSIGYDCRHIGDGLHMPNFIKKKLVSVLGETRRILYPRWFHLASEINKFCIYNNNKKIESANGVATACTTADIVYNNNFENKLYLIQGYETWADSESSVKATYRLDMKNIVISSWLKNIVDEVTGNNDSTLIKNGINREEFYIDIPLEKRGQKLCMLYHNSEKKGSLYGVKAIEKIKCIYPELEVTLFGTSRRPYNLPGWIKYVQNANVDLLREIYNESKVFLYPALEDGFGLTCIESMACGCALCSTNYNGVYEFAVNEKNALLSPVRDVEAMVSNIKRLLSDDNFRIKIANSGHDSICKFDWDTSVDAFENMLK